MGADVGVGVAVAAAKHFEYVKIASRTAGGNSRIFILADAISSIPSAEQIPLGAVELVGNVDIQRV